MNKEERKEVEAWRKQRQGRKLRHWDLENREESGGNKEELRVDKEIEALKHRGNRRNKES